ncbi:hypothetical protein EVAR_12336_1 [Eumeta japonica]|uniref:Uncharacterized protein n=1 Tax=Eumeta variegata TaxID=151549 RepID=A0A4C1WYV9_EUMVA|nr:hypothetical protein EVAR_12336_1 [Eumeta japonica]
MRKFTCVSDQSEYLHAEAARFPGELFKKLLQFLSIHNGLYDLKIRTDGQNYKGSFWFLHKEPKKELHREIFVPTCLLFMRFLKGKQACTLSGSRESPPPIEPATQQASLAAGKPSVGIICEVVSVKIVYVGRRPAPRRVRIAIVLSCISPLSSVRTW